MHPREVVALVEQIKPILAGKDSGVQGAALADLLAIWLAGHVFPGDPAGTAAIRDELLSFHIGSVRELIPVNARAMGTDV